ncbi:hypothetical protein CEXT_318651 [Caerostris extrusa]|uniref:Uncharacterized protein n=1 Tax=Caerostris extrusa TaxID=172846 RepID=A0AAV4TTS9_CAEEX|nr:hypothetical protein CEXT_318651 [Caerostris extrusa]
MRRGCNMRINKPDLHPCFMKSPKWKGARINLVPLRRVALLDTNVQGPPDLGPAEEYHLGPSLMALLLSRNVPEVNIERKRLELMEREQICG